MALDRLLPALLCLAGLAGGCASPPEFTLFERRALDDGDPVPAMPGVIVDPSHAVSGHGSLRVVSEGTMVVPLLELDAPDLESTRLRALARIRTRDLEGEAYLEMVCRFADRGDYHSHGYRSRLSGSTTWTDGDVDFVLGAGDTPEKLDVNVVVTGPGTVWVDDLRLYRTTSG